MAEKNERYAEKLIQDEMKINLGRNVFGSVYIQGEKCNISAINDSLKLAGGKPKICELSDYTASVPNKKSAQPEFIITFDKEPDTIIVIECKKSLKNHESELRNHPANYAVDGVLYYAKYLKNAFNVIAIAESGTDVKRMRVSTFYWQKGHASYDELIKIQNILLEPENYIKILKGEKITKSYNLEQIQKMAVDMHDSLRINKMTERLKPLFVAGILLALQDDVFCCDYDKLSNFSSLLDSCCTAIDNVLNDGEIEQKKVTEIKNKFREIESVIKLKNTPLIEDNSLRWYIKQLEMKVKPMMDYIGNTVDALGVFYHEFISYSSGDGNSLGIVLTPQHLTEFMAEAININKKSKVIDICCGSGAFLVTAMGIMFKQAQTPQEIEYIRKNCLYGIEQDSDIHTLALANMIMRRDGKSHIIHGDCFDDNTLGKVTNLRDTEGKAIQINKALLNPPYSQKDHIELEFVSRALSILPQGGELAVVCPMSCAIGTKFKEERKLLMEKHTLKAVFSMPDDIFYGNNASTKVCVMIWEAQKPHDTTISTFFGYYKDDGFIKKRKLGRIDANKRWCSIKDEWLRLYREKDEVDGYSVKCCVSADDEWLCEAYMKTDYTKLAETDFQLTINNLCGYLVKAGKYPSLKYTSSKAPKLNSAEWMEFRIGDLFDIHPTKRIDGLTADDCTNKGYPLVVNSSENNGVKGLCDEHFTEPGNIITFSDTTDGNTFFYQPEPFIGFAHVQGMYPKNDKITANAMLFICSVLRFDARGRYNYGRKMRRDTISNISIKLPFSTDRTPDWQFMENYIKSLPYGDILQKSKQSSPNS